MDKVSSSMRRTLKLWNMNLISINKTKFVSYTTWVSRSIDYQNLTGKNAAIFGDATQTPSMTKILTKERGIHVNCAGIFFYVF
jgi:hypothetical protein